MKKRQCEEMREKYEQLETRNQSQENFETKCKNQNFGAIECICE